MSSPPPDVVSRIGGTGNSSSDDDLRVIFTHGIHRPVQINVWSDTVLHGVQFIYAPQSSSTNQIAGQIYGTQSGTNGVYQLQPNEYICKVTGTVDPPSSGWTGVISSIAFYTNLGGEQPVVSTTTNNQYQVQFNESGGEHYALSHLAGCYNTSISVVDSLMLNWAPISRILRSADFGQKTYEQTGSFQVWFDWTSSSSNVQLNVYLKNLLSGVTIYNIKMVASANIAGTGVNITGVDGCISQLSPNAVTKTEAETETETGDDPTGSNPFTINIPISSQADLPNLQLLYNFTYNVATPDGTVVSQPSVKQVSFQNFATPYTDCPPEQYQQ